MRSDHRSPRVRDTVLLSGWLFADLLLGLAVIFLAANTVGVKPQLIPTPTPTPIPAPSPSPTATPLPRLELNKHRLTLTIDTNGLLNNSQGAINDLKRQVRAQTFLHGRRAGLVIAYGSAPDVTQIVRAQNVANKVMSVLQSLGNEGFVFIQTSYYDPLYVLYASNPNTVVIDIYLFAQ
jgi:hypothetical protein